jgi:hypothetical protein
MFPKSFCIGLLLAAAVPAVAAAQSAAVAPGLDQRLQRDFGADPRVVDPAEASLTGHDDVVLLTRRKFFTLQAQTSGQYTDNATLSQTERKASSIGSYSVIGSAGTRLGGLVDVSTAVGLLGSRYSAGRDLGYDVLFGSLAAARRQSGFELNADYSWQALREAGFGSRQLNQHRVAGGVGYPLTVASGRLRFTPTLIAEKSWASPKTYNSSAYGLQVPIGVSLSPRLFASVRLSAVRRKYPDYFPGLLGVKRVDNQYGAELSIYRVLTPSASIRLQTNLIDNHSTSDVNRYRNATGLLGIAMELKF